MSRWSSLLYLLVLLSSPCFAQSNDALPLQGWYRGGRYMPVRVHGAVHLTADGAVPVDCTAERPAPFIVPVLTFSADVKNLRIDGVPIAGNPTLHPLLPHQQLIAVSGAGDPLARKMFPGENIISIRIDPNDPLPGPAMAWQSLDALIIDGAWPDALDLHKTLTLLAGGLQIGVRTIQKPDVDLPWESIDGGWVVRPFIAGPLGCDGDASAYETVASWYPDLPTAVRWQVVFASILFSVLVVGSLLLPRKISVAAIAVVTVVAIGGIELWERSRDRSLSAVGTVTVDHPSWRQSDRWTFFTTRQSAEGHAELATDLGWLIFADATQPLRENVVLLWDGQSLRYRFWLKTGGKIAFISRLIERPADEEAANQAGRSPMMSLAKSLYQRANDQVNDTAAPGNAIDPNSDWGTIHIKRSP